VLIQLGRLPDWPEGNYVVKIKSAEGFAATSSSLARRALERAAQGSKDTNTIPYRPFLPQPFVKLSIQDATRPR
jgi:hypothetical protein